MLEMFASKDRAILGRLINADTRTLNASNSLPLSITHPGRKPVGPELP